LCFLDAIELDESEPFRRDSIKPSYVSGTDDIVTACGFSLFGKGFVSLGIGFDFQPVARKALKIAHENNRGVRSHTVRGSRGEQLYDQIIIYHP